MGVLFDLKKRIITPGGKVRKKVRIQIGSDHQTSDLRTPRRLSYLTFENVLWNVFRLALTSWTLYNLIEAVVVLTATCNIAHPSKGVNLLVFTHLKCN